VKDSLRDPVSLKESFTDRWYRLAGRLRRQSVQFLAEPVFTLVPVNSSMIATFSGA